MYNIYDKLWGDDITNSLIWIFIRTGQEMFSEKMWNFKMSQLPYFLSDFHNFCTNLWGNFYSFFWNYVNSGLDFPFNHKRAGGGLNPPPPLGIFRGYSATRKYFAAPFYDLSFESRATFENFFLTIGRTVTNSSDLLNMHVGPKILCKMCFSGNPWKLHYFSSNHFN